MDQLIGQFGHIGPIDLTVRPDSNARVALSAVTLNGKKGLFGKLGSLVKTGSIRAWKSGPGHGKEVPDTRVPKGPNSQKVDIKRVLCVISLM